MNALRDDGQPKTSGLKKHFFAMVNKCQRRSVQSSEAEQVLVSIYLVILDSDHDEKSSGFQIS
jgi:hypothetical protein